MVIRVYVSTTSGNMEIKKKQEHIRQVLETRKIDFEQIDIAAPENEAEKQFMRENAEPEEGKNFVLPPQIFNNTVYCGSYTGFQDAVEIDNLPEFLKLYLQEEEEVQEEVIAVEERTEVHMAPPIPDSRFNDSSPPERDGRTLLPTDHFDCEQDCEKLRAAMKGFGTDEAAIINVMGHRSKEQIQEIILMYKQMFGKDLIKDLQGELSGDFENVIIGLCQSNADFDADQLRKAMKGLGTDEQCLIDILCTRTNREITDIIAAYKRIHSRNLEEDIVSETSGDFRRLLVSLLQGVRSEDENVDRHMARNEAKELYEAGEQTLGTDESVFNKILCTRSYPQLVATFDEYEAIADKDITASIKSELSGDLEKGMLAIVGCARNKPQHFADVLHDSMAGLGTSDSRLIRVCVSRCEIDMVQIKEEFLKKYGEPLGKMIAGDLSGDYRRIILAIVAEEEFNK